MLVSFRAILRLAAPQDNSELKRFLSLASSLGIVSNEILAYDVIRMAQASGIAQDYRLAERKLVMETVSVIVASCLPL